MKKSTFKKVFAIILALVLTFAMSVPAFASTAGDGEDDYTITITPGAYTDVKKTDRYKAYEVFTGDLTPDPEEGTLTEEEMNQLRNIKWGDDVDVDKLVEALTADGNPFGDAFDGVDDIEDADLQASTVARLLDTNSATEGFAKAFAIAVQKSLKLATAEAEENKAHPVSSTYDSDEESPTYGKFNISLDKSGYYLIVDNPNNDPAVAKGDIISEHLLQVVRDRQLNVKSSTPTSKKEIASGYGGYEIGKLITFRLTGTLAENFNNYTNAYQYKFVDTMSKGLTYVGDDKVTVEVWSVKKGTGELDKKVENITLTKSKTGTEGNYTIATQTLTEPDRTKLTIAFDNLKEIENLKAEYVIVVTYKAYINYDAVIGTAKINEAHLEFSNDPYNGGSTTEAPDNRVAVETLELDLIKKDAVTGDALAGVKFNLYYVDPGEDATETDDDTIYYGNFTSNNAGTYTLLKENGWTTTKGDAAELVTVEDGILNIKGLGTGTYYLVEAETPSGYNALPGPIEINISATYYVATDDKVIAGTKVEGEIKTVSATFKIDGETSALVFEAEDRETEPTLGVIPIDILNVPISSLPRTGGIGNYIFYIGGGLLVAAAVVFFIVSKKKSSAREAE